MRILLYIKEKRKWIIPIMLLLLIIAAVISYSSMHQMTTPVAIEDNEVGVFVEMHNAKIDRLQERLDKANSQNAYLKNITPLVIIRPTEDITKIKFLQEQLDLANSKINPTKGKDPAVITRTVIENTDNDSSGTNNPSIYVADPVDINTKVQAPPKANILHLMITKGGSYTDIFEREQGGQ